MSDPVNEIFLQRLERLNAIGVALSAEKNTERLLEMILLGAKEITRADGGTLYLVTEDRHLKFEIMHTGSLDLRLGGATGDPVPFEPLPLYDESGAPNEHMVAAHVALSGRTINIADAYQAQGFDFSGTRAFDHKTGYRSKSFLAVPMRNHENEIIGVLQLINATDTATGEIVPFGADDQRLAESLASQAAVALTNKRLIDAQRLLFESFIKLIASAIDEKSPYTGGHCARVPELTMMLAEAAHDSISGPLKDFRMDPERRYELKIAAWLHDCGKIVTPEYVVDKATKLETIFDRIHLVDSRFEILRRDALIESLQKRLEARGEAKEPIRDKELSNRIRHLDEDQGFLRRTNVGGEHMDAGDQDRVRRIAEHTWRNAEGEEQKILSDDEVYNLIIPKGTLTPEERKVINNHMDVTIKMLEALPYPKHLRNVPEYAGGHHERMDGKGYPRGLTREQMPVQARIMGIADIFEALTARDRPYKTGKTLTEALEILGRMKQDNHIDPDLFDLFVRERIYLRYAEKFLDPEQIDDVDHSRIPGYAP